jgi:hypothetical protein
VRVENPTVRIASRSASTRRRTEVVGHAGYYAGGMNKSAMT